MPKTTSTECLAKRGRLRLMKSSSMLVSSVAKENSYGITTLLCKRQVLGVTDFPVFAFDVVRGHFEVPSPSTVVILNKVVELFRLENACGAEPHPGGLVCCCKVSSCIAPGPSYACESQACSMHRPLLIFRSYCLWKVTLIAFSPNVIPVVASFAVIAPSSSSYSTNAIPIRPGTVRTSL